MALSKAARDERKALAAQGLKRCSNPECDNPIKPLSEFSKHKRDGYRSWCKPCHIAENTAYRQTNPERERERYRKYHTGNRELRREYCTARRQADPLWMRLAGGATRARQLGCEVEKFTSADLLVYWEANGIAADRCYYSGAELGDGWHLDHMVPLSRGGSHSVENVVPCTPEANVDKGNRTADEYTTRERIPA
jgi:hypothetical protein